MSLGQGLQPGVGHQAQDHFGRAPLLPGHRQLGRPEESSSGKKKKLLKPVNWFLNRFQSGFYVLLRGLSYHGYLQRYIPRWVDLKKAH